MLSGMPRLSHDPTDDPRWQAILASQRGIVHTHQLVRDLGLPPKFLRSQIDARRW